MKFRALLALGFEKGLKYVEAGSSNCGVGLFLGMRARHSRSQSFWIHGGQSRHRPPFTVKSWTSIKSL